MIDDMMEKEILALVKKCRGSSFNRSNYQVNIDLSNFVRSLLLHTWSDERMDSERRMPDDKNFNTEWAKKVVPDFQRANNKWNKNMKLRFIENLLSGVKVELMFFRFHEHHDAQIIDGLQRTTAILDFLSGKIKPFGYSYHDLKDHLGKFRSHNLTIKIYTFSTWEEVGRFYVDMNENITHSKADIQKAKDWFLNEKNIKL